MTPLEFALAAAIVVDVAYGYAVYLANPRRPTNQAYLALSLNIGLWLAAVWHVLTAQSDAAAERWMRLAFTFCTSIPTLFNMMRWTIKDSRLSWPGAVLKSWRILLLNAGIWGMCQTNFFLREVHLPGPGSSPWDVAEPVYGPGFFLFNTYYLIALGWLIVSFARDRRKTTGIQRAELEYALLSCGASIFTGSIFALLIPAITGSSRTAPMAPVGVIVLNIIVAYGIATRRIMGVALILRRATAYALLTVYLCLLYAGVHGLSQRVFAATIPGMETWPHFLAAIVVAFSVAPANGRMQQIARKLFINVTTVDSGSMLRQVGEAMRALSTTADMARQFADIVGKNMDTDRVQILLNVEGNFTDVYPVVETPMQLASSDPLVHVLQTNHRPLVAETLRRRPLSKEVAAALDELDRLHMSTATAVRYKGRLSGIVLLGPRLSGRMYGATEEDTLQLVCDELAVALENARLFTETRNSRIYNDILLDNLGTGVIAMDQQQVITTINRDAQRIVGQQAHEVLGKTCGTLPEPLGSILRDTLTTGARHADEEVRLESGSTNRQYVRVGGSVFHSHTGEPLGALIVFHDVTNLKHLQNQVRRSDRLASMGTLSAGMAHEIKNPLVTIKTFTQLLPERYDDPEFRESFLSLMSAEVRRIDSLVNQLLTFARPSKPSLVPVRMRDVVEDSLRLVAQQLERHHVTVSRDYRCAEDTVLADADLLSQAFVNFFLNAQDAMLGGGALRISTSLVQNSRARPRTGSTGTPETAVLLRVEDNGVGINEDDLAHIFDPFFTTKSHGTGLGLAVAHGIVDEQGGVIDVQSRLGSGTAFLITFPLYVAKEAA